MKIFQLTFFCLLLSVGAKGQYLEWNSLLEENSASSSVVSHSIVSPFGDIHTAGTFNGTVDLKPDPNATFNISSAIGSTKNVFFAKYDDDGALLLGKHIWGRSSVTVNGFDLDAQGNMFLTGYFNDTIDLNTSSGSAYYTPVTSTAEDLYIVKYSSIGNYQWGRQLVSGVFTRPSDLALDMTGNVIVAGSFRGVTDFDPGIGNQSLTSWDEDIFIAKYNSSGNYVNAIRIGAIPPIRGIQNVSNIEVDASGSIYVSGRFQGTVDFDPGGGVTSLTANGTDDFYLAKYNNSLQLVWAYGFGSSQEEGTIDHKIYGSEMWVAGSFKDSIDLNLKAGISPHVSQGNFDVFFAKYHLNADFQVSKSFGGSGVDEAISIDYFKDDSLMISGHFEGTVDFDASPGSSSNLTSSSSKTTFFGSYDQSGSLNWVSKISGTNDVENTLIRTTTSGKPLVYGHLKGVANFNHVSPFVKNSTGPASFISKYKKCGEVSFSITTKDASCGVRDGSASAVVTGGSLPLRYFWTSGHVTANADSLRSNTYYLNITDTLNCHYVSDPVLISENGGPTVVLASKTDVSCNGGKDGVIKLTVSGGRPPYTYKWSNGAKTKNLNGLQAGNYEIVVSDKDKCKTLLKVAVIQPDPIQLSSALTAPGCSASNGSIVVNAYGGTSTYTYSWLPSGSGNTLTGLSAGVYTVTVTDSKSCTYTETIALSNDKAPDIYLDSISTIECGSGGGSIYVNVLGGSPAYNYLWSPGSSTSQDLIMAPGGSYKLEVTDNASCKAYFTETLGSKRPPKPEECIVDVDSVSGYATVVWEKPSSSGKINHYSVFRETSTLNMFDLVKDSVDFHELSLFVDRKADTWTRPWSYKISLTDTCGVESELSGFHTTIHAVITKNAQQEFNILWSPYRGNFTVSQYAIYRYTDTTGTIDLVTMVPANIFSFTDVNSPSKGSDVYYFVEVVHPDGCTATDAQNRNSSRSNRGSIAPPELDTSTVIPELNRPDLDILLYPNPASQSFNIKLNSKRFGQGQIALYDIQGSEIWNLEITLGVGEANFEFPIDNLIDGLYLVQVKIGDDIHLAKLMIASD